ncbi:MAG: class I SAM-dependent methyltransferase [Thermoleophilia bacterium]
MELFQTVSDQATKKAYSRMQINVSHSWAQHAESEVECVIDLCELQDGASVLDLGCGNGRHTFALAERGMNVVGVDYLKNRINEAREKSEEDLEFNKPLFVLGDCRSIDLKREFDCVICLYDVVGTFIEESENMKILTNISRHLQVGGYALISVMNYALTKARAKNIFVFEDHPNELLKLAASQIMEQTGNIFDPDYYLLDEGTGIVYRKEQFMLGKSLPAEYIVRDRRYYKNQIETMCESAGLKVLISKHTCAGRWDLSLPPDHQKAKEVLLLCTKIRKNEQMKLLEM